MEDNQAIGKPTIGDVAPGFHAVTTQGEINFPKDYSGKWVVLFSFPMDFEPVSTTELMTFAAMMNEFRECESELLGLSTASVYSHIAWLRKIRELAWKDMKHIDITFPLIEDPTLEITAKYAMLYRSACAIQPGRAVYIIDPEGIIRAILFYPLQAGRSISEIKRVLVALQKADSEKVSVPADWIPSEDVIVPSPKTCPEASDRMEKVNENMYCLDWFLSFRQADTGEKNIQQQPEFNNYPSASPMRRRNNYRR